MKDIQTQLVLRNSPVGSHQSNGMAESRVKVIEGIVRTMRSSLERKLNISIVPAAPIVPWMVRHGAFVTTRYTVRPSGRTPYEELYMTQYTSPVLMFAESVLARKIVENTGKFVSSWESGLWLGRSTTTNEHIVGTTIGVIKVRTVKRRPEELQWDKFLYEAMVWKPWSTDVDPQVLSM